MATQHYLITGGAGFIGSNLIRSLFRDEPDCRITSIDNFDPFYPVAVKEFNTAEFRDHPGFTMHRLDLGQITGAGIAAFIKEPVDVIVHLAAKAGVRPSIMDPLAYQLSNVIGLQNLLDFARIRNIKQFVFGSSSSVYGINEHFPWKEDEQLMPISPYASTKLYGEMLGHVYSRNFGLRFIALRFFTVYGPGQRPDLAIHRFTRSILTGTPIPFFGDGSTSRDYTYVEDILQGVRAAMNYTASDFEIINLGNHADVQLKDLLAAVEKVMGKKAIINYMPDQPGDVPRTCADISKAQRLLGYHPATKLEDGLKSFYDWFIANQDLLLPGPL